MCIFVHGSLGLLLVTTNFLHCFNFQLFNYPCCITIINKHECQYLYKKSCSCMTGRILLSASNFWCKRSNLDERQFHLKKLCSMVSKWLSRGIFYILMNRHLLRCKVSAIILQHIMASSKIVFTRALMELMLFVVVVKFSFLSRSVTAYVFILLAHTHRHKKNFALFFFLRVYIYTFLSQLLYDVYKGKVLL